MHLPASQSTRLVAKRAIQALIVKRHLKINRWGQSASMADENNDVGKLDNTTHPTNQYLFAFVDWWPS